MNQIFQVTFNKTYKSSAEENSRMQIFFDNLETISLHNQAFDAGNVTFKMAINQLSDLTFDEFTKMNEIASVSLSLYRPLDHEIDENDNTDVPPSFDWRTRGAISKVKDQKLCGACYAIAAISALESQIFIKSGNLTELSVQEILECAGENYHSWGCDGGLFFRVFEYINDEGGISSEADYPFNLTLNMSCKSSNVTKVPIKIDGYVVFSYGDRVLKKALINVGPVIASIAINHESFMSYSSGVFMQPNCNSSQSNHALLLVGYGEENGTEYWLAKNSYGETWGESGYIKIATNRDEHCGIDTELFYPLVNSEI